MFLLVFFSPPPETGPKAFLNNIVLDAVYEDSKVLSHMRTNLFVGGRFRFGYWQF